MVGIATAVYVLKRIGGQGIELLEFVVPDAIECSLEIVQDDRVGQAFEDESELPEGVDAVG